MVFMASLIQMVIHQKKDNIIRTTAILKTMITTNSANKS